MEESKEQNDNSLRFKYSIKERIVIALLSSFTFLFIYLIFGPIDIYLNNFDEYVFSLNDFIVPLLLIFFSFFIMMPTLIALFRGVGINITTSFIMAFIIYGYIDAFFINKLEFAGGDVSAEYTTYRAITMAVFFIVFQITLIASLLLRKKWKNVIIFLSVLFIGMNLTGLIADVLMVDVSKDKIQNTYVESKKGMLEVAQKENVIFFLFDRFDTDYYKEVIQDDPTFFDDLDGFTYYDNNITHYLRTFPSVAYMITGIEYTGKESPEEYLETCYKNSNFLSDLKENGYNINLYSDKHYTYVNGESLLEIADNIEPVSSIETKKYDIAEYLVELSLYRNFSYFLSLKMVYDTNNFTVSKLTNIKSEDGFYDDSDDVYYKELCENGLKISNNEKNYIFIHLNGSHTPYILDENCQKSDEATALSQTKGSFLIIKKYIDELKRLGLYDNSTIIISGDHGIPYSDSVPIYEWYNLKYIDEGPTVAMFFKPKNSNDKLKYSSAPVQSANIIPSIVQETGITTNIDYGYSINDIENGAKQNRTYYHMNHMNKKRKIRFDIYDVGDDAREINNWKYRETIETNYSWY